MEEFEFKPLTDGLGFHKKKLEDESNQKLPSFLDDDTTFKTLPQAPEKVEAKKKILEEKVSGLPFDFSSTQATSNSLFSPTLPRETQKTKEASKLEAHQSAITVPKLNSPKFKQIDKTAPAAVTNVAVEQPIIQKAEAVSNKIELPKETPVYKPSFNFITSMILDFFVVMGLAVLFTLGLVLATGLDIVSIVTQSFADLGTQIGVGLLVYSVAQLYMIISRSFFGQTLGEWSIEQQLGTPEQQEKFAYVFKLLWRTLLISFTGFITLPLISLIARKDITGKLSGVSIYKRE